MRRIISRPCRAALPLGLGIYSLLAPGGAARALMLITALLLARGLSLAAGGALRAAAGSVIRASRLRGNLLTAAMTAAIGGVILLILCMLPIPLFNDIGIWTAAAGALINLSQVFADRMYSSEDFRSAAVYDIIIAALAAVTLLISETDPWLMTVLPGCGMLAGLLLLGGLKNGTSLQPGMKVLKFAPLALVRGWIFPAIMTAAAIALEGMETDIAAVLAGIAVLEWCEPVFRRSDEESRACSVLLSAISAVWVVLCAAAAISELNIPECNSCAPIITGMVMYAVPVGCFGAMVTGLHINWRRAVMCLMLASSGLGLAAWITGVMADKNTLLMVAIPFVVCFILTIPDMLALRRIAKAKKIQRKRR